VHFLFHGELNDFLSLHQRDVRFEHTVGATDTVKHVIESLGVPHTEIGRIVIGGAEAGFSAALAEEAGIDVYPHALPIHFEHAPKFVADGHLGRFGGASQNAGI
jgi:hypothetical protein